MKITHKTSAIMLGVVLGMTVPMAAQAHRSWLLPSSTVLSGENPWVTIDAATSNELFYFDHNPGRLENLVITGPDGKTVEAQNAHTGKYRSSFDVQLNVAGTYRIALVSDGVTANYTDEKGEQKRWRGTAEKMATEVPANAKDLKVSYSTNRIETFATSGKPTDAALKPTNKGLELAPITHPNDLFAGELARFKLLLDGKPAANLKVTVIPGGIRYRDKLNETEITTNANGEFEVTWTGPGMYWLNASIGGGRPGEGAAQTGGQPARRINYSATLEVLP